MVPSPLLTKCQNILEIKGGKLPDMLSISTDTRELKDCNTFICLYGPTFDGHSFIGQAAEKGIQVIVAESSHCSSEQLKQLKKQNIAVVLVKNTLEFIQELGGIWSRAWQEKGGLIIAITGSSGKTTNKEMLVHLFKSVLKNKVHWTKKNLNNHIGVPLTIFNIESKHQLAVVEMGSNHPGEISLLCKVANPSAGLITNIGPAHLEFFKNLEGVYQEKTALFRWVKRHKEYKIFIAFADDPYLIKLKNQDKVISFGTNGEYQYKRKGHTLILDNGRKNYQICNNFIYGNHNFINLAQTFLLAVSLFPEESEILLKAAEQFRPSDKNRGLWHQLPKGRQVFLDAYNANPASVRASFQGFREMTENIPRKKLFLSLEI